MVTPLPVVDSTDPPASTVTRCSPRPKTAPADVPVNEIALRWPKADNAAITPDATTVTLVAKGFSERIAAAFCATSAFPARTETTS